MAEVVVVSAARLVYGKHGGCYRLCHATDLGIEAINAALGKANLDVRERNIFVRGNGNPVRIDQIIGTAPLYHDPTFQTHYSPNVAHGVGLPDVPSHYVQKVCGSGFQAIVAAYDKIQAGKARAVIIYGAENMTRAPRIHTGLRRLDNIWRFEESGTLEDTIFRSLAHDEFETMMAKTAELLGKANGLTRDEVDEYAAESYRRAKEAWMNGLMRGAVSVAKIRGQDLPNVSKHDENIDFNMTLERMREMKPLLDLTLVTRGNASKVADGSAAMILMDRSYADELGLPYSVIVSDYHEATCDPKIMGYAPVPVVQGYLTKIGKSISDFDLFVINEAFAAQVLSVIRLLGLDMSITNPNGGAIAIGHPITATGVGLSVDAAHELIRRNGKRALVTACIGGGQATLVELVKV